VATSIKQLAAALETTATAADRTPYDIAAAVAGIGHLGRALVAAAETTRRGNAFDALAGQLGQECVDLAASAPPAETRTTLLAAAMADSVRLQLPAASITQRRVLISRAVDSLTPMFAAVAESPGSGPRQRLEGIEVLADEIQQMASLTPHTLDANQIQHRSSPTHAAASYDAGQPAELPTAMGQLLALTTTASRGMTVSEMLQVSIACEVVARCCEPPPVHRLTEPPPQDLTAADAWLAVQASLAALRGRPTTTDTCRPDITATSLMVARTALFASSSDHSIAAQHLPDLADDLYGAARHWSDAIFNARTSPLPGDRRRPATLERAIARISGSLDAAATLSVVLADQAGHRERGRTAFWTRHHQQAHEPEFREAAGEAQAVAYTCIRPNFLALAAERDGDRNTILHTETRAAVPQQASRLASQRPADETLPTGYKIAESGTPELRLRYQVLYGSGRAQQLIGIRDERAAAVQLAYQHHSRVETQRGAQLRRPSPPPPTPHR
jgi:hypothetical protein